VISSLLLFQLVVQFSFSPYLLHISHLTDPDVISLMLFDEVA
jgi:hypothetical protein